MINIAFNIDSKYVRFCGVLITSILQNNTDTICFFHVFGSGLSSNDKEQLTSLLNGSPNLIKFYDIDDSILKGFPVSTSWPKVIYYRLFIPELVQTTEKILYMDSDIICNGSLLPLFNTDLGDCIIGASEDTLSHCNALINTLGYDINYYYFNSGVMLINPIKWKEYNITERCINYIASHHVSYPDQDALNAILYNKWKRIYFKWNFLSTFHDAYVSYKDFLADYYKTEKDHPVLIHFNGLKPWDSRCRDPYKALFYKYQNYTTWKRIIPRHNIKEYIIHFRKFILDKIGVVKIDPYYTFNISEPNSKK